MDLEGLYRKYSPMAFRVCLRYTGDREEAEDLTQEVFLKIHGQAESFRGESQPGTWIYRIAINACIDHLRAKRRRNALALERLDELVRRNLSDHGDAIAAKMQLDRILEELKPEVRQILFLTFAEGLDYGQAAEVVGMTKAGVAQIVSRLRRRLADSRDGRSK